MDGLYLECESSVEMHVLCIGDLYQWWVIAVDHNSKFKTIYAMVKPLFMI